MKKMFIRLTRGFTLIELLVVISIIAILAAVLVPAVSDALTNGKMTGTLNNGKQIFTSAFARTLDGVVTPSASAAWPDSVTYYSPGCGAYFTNLVGSGAMRVDYSFFSASGIQVYKGTNGANFMKGSKQAGDCNAWNIAADLGDQNPDAVPFLWTKNLVMKANLTESQPNNDLISLLKPVDGQNNTTPYGNKGVITVYKGGSAVKYKPDVLTSNFNTAGGTNTILFAK
jgi:prepilin-type N-terminal cleavage/methylation domain-containing protein